MIHNPNTIYTYYESGDQNSRGENTRDFEVDPMVIDSYIKAFGVMNDEAFDPIIEKRTFDIIENNRAAIIALLYVYPKKFDRGSERNVEKKVEALKNAGLTVSQILDICASNIKVISSREDKYWRQVELLIYMEMPSDLLYEMLCTRPSKKNLKSTTKGILSIKPKSH